MGLLDNLSDEQRDKASKKKQPAFMKPMLARLTHDTFSDDNWIYERKLDGERCLAVSRRGSVTLYSRNRSKLNATYPEIVDALEDQEETGFIIDGEIVTFDGKITSFKKLQDRMGIQDADEARNSGVKVYYYIFDILFTDSHDVCKVPLLGRKTLLKRALDFSSPLRLTSYRKKEGEKYHKEACKKGWEGVIAKKSDAGYKHSRSSDWLKFKCVNEQELVIGGFTDPEGQRRGFGALLVGYYKSGKLQYAGKVGTGYDDETLQKLGKKLSSIERKTSPFDDEDISEKGVHWVKPELVGQFGFTEWTDDDKLRHPRYLGLRRDKSPKKVHKES